MVLTFPHPLRYRLAYDAQMVTDVLDIFTKTIFESLIRRAREFGAARKAQSGAVTFIQRFDSALRVNLHLHSLCMDGVYAADDDDDQPHFQVLPAPDDEEIGKLTSSLAERITRFLIRRGLGPDSDPEEADPLSQQEPWLSRLYAAAVTGKIAFGPRAGRRVTRAGDQIDPDSMEVPNSPRCASVAGFSLHANVDIHAGDRDRLERLIRYCARPPIAMERLEPLAEGRLLYRFKRPWRNGTTHIVFQPLELLEKLAALIPAPKAHLVRYAGIFAPAAKWRASIVPPAAAAATPTVQIESAPMNDCLGVENRCEPSPAGAAGGPPPELSPARHGRNYSWAELMKRVWALDVLECPHCHGRLRIVAAIHATDAIQKILECLGLPSRAPPIAPASPEFIETQPF